MRISRSLVALLVVTGCGHGPVRLVVVTSSLAQAVSFLGDTLYSVPLNPAGGPGRVQRIVAARDQLARDSSNLKAWLDLGRSTTEMGRLRDAVAIYSKVAEAHFDDPRVYRERGEILLQLRELGLAIADFHKAGLLLLNRGKLIETINAGLSATDTSSVPRVELTTTQYQTFFQLGIAHYCAGDFTAAYKVLAEAAGIALTYDDLARALLWLFFALRRVGDGAQATHVLAMVQPAWSSETTAPELALLLAFRGDIPSDSIQARALRTEGEERALYSYGIAYFLQLQPSRRADADLWLERAREGPDWTRLPYLAAEADLARLRGRPPKPS